MQCFQYLIDREWKQHLCIILYQYSKHINGFKDTLLQYSLYRQRCRSKCHSANRHLPESGTELKGDFEKSSKGINYLKSAPNLKINTTRSESNLFRLNLIRVSFPFFAVYTSREDAVVGLVRKIFKEGLFIFSKVFFIFSIKFH